MTTDERMNPRLGRRGFLQAAAAAMAIPAVARATKAFAQEKLAGTGEVVTYSTGGSNTQAYRKAIYEPFTKATGIKIVEVTADFAEPQVKAMKQAGRVDWDTAFIQAQYYPEMHSADIFAPIDYSIWDAESVEGIPTSERMTDAVVAYGSTVLLTYDKRVFSKNEPKTWQTSGM